jgi:hypothetical protein
VSAVVIEARARRAPVAILLFFAWEIAWSLVVATPIHAWARRVWGAHPDGDSVLFRRGGHELALWLASGDAAAAVTVRTTLVLLFLGVLAGQVPLAALLARLTRRMSMTEALAVAFRAWLPLSGLVVLTTAVQAALLAGGIAGGGALAASRSTGALVGCVAAVATGAVLCIVVGVVADLTRVVLVASVAGPTLDSPPARAPGLTLLLSSILSALRTARRKLSAALLAWSLRALASVVLLAFAWWAGSVTGARGGLALGALFVGRQLLVLARVGVRASWLAYALRLSAPRSDTPARTAEPLAPIPDPDA